PCSVSSKHLEASVRSTVSVSSQPSTASVPSTPGRFCLSSGVLSPLLRHEAPSRRNPVDRPEKCPAGGTSAACGSSMSCRGFRRLWGIFPSHACVGLLPGFLHDTPSWPGGGRCVASVPSPLRRQCQALLGASA